MGGFIVFPKVVEEFVEAVEERFCRSLEVFQKKNLALGSRIVRNNFVAYRYCKLSSHTESVAEFDNGDFAFCTGTFIYDDKTGKNALIQSYKDLVSGSLDENKIAGNFHLLVYKNGELWSLSDYCGYYPVYIDDASKVISTSYLAVARVGGSPKLSQQGFFDYVFHGFFVNEETLIRGVRLLDSRKFWRHYPTMSQVERTPVFDSFTRDVSPSEVVEKVSCELNAYYENLVKLFPQDIGSALSGGFDSRHMLALLRHAGATPSLYVYGTPDTSDVLVAKEITRGEKLSLDHIDKGASKKIDIDTFHESIERNLYFFDGIKPVGLIDDGSDLATRLARARDANLQLNGAGGEIYREIWNIPDKSVGLEKFLKMRFDQGFYGYCHGEFSADAYFAGLADKVRGILKIDGDTLPRQQAEMLFPFMRNKFAQSNNAANSQISHSLLPFMEPRFVIPSFDIPIKYKYCGELHAALIRAADPALAKYNSAYGINFSDPIPWLYRMRLAGERHLPLSLRLIKRAHGASKPQAMPYFLEKPYIESIVDLNHLEISEYLDMSKIMNPEILSRALSVELLLQHL
ncbi:hypothetical protein [Propionivibrio sp.]|uniref:hypothetical protein n=1 Tax=Propionivibrio sp. TaxID=2212460 RepID=UPI003BEFE70C